MKASRPKSIAISLMVFLTLSLFRIVGADVPVPDLTGRVVDQTGTLSSGDIQQLDARLRAFEDQKGSQVAVLIVPTTAPEEIEQFSIRVVDKWKLGRKKVDDGVLLLVAKDDRAMRIEVGYGLEGALTDLATKRIISDIITPRFKDGDFSGGIDAGVDAILKVIQGEPLPLPPAGGTGSSSGYGSGSRHRGGLGGGILMAGLAVAMVLRSIFGRLVGGVIAGGLIGVAATFILGSLIIGVFAGILSLIFVLIGAGGGLGGGGWSSGGSGGFGGGSGGFGSGGFSGGGGGFGGGGASGRW